MRHGADARVSSSRAYGSANARASLLELGHQLQHGLQGGWQRRQGGGGGWEREAGVRRPSARPTAAGARGKVLTGPTHTLSAACSASVQGRERACSGALTVTRAVSRMSVEIKLSRSDRVYHPGEELKGEILIVSRGSPLQHGGITLATSGSVQLRLSEKSVGVFESLFLSVRPIPLLNEVIEVRARARDRQSRPCTELGCSADSTRAQSRRAGRAPRALLPGVSARDPPRRHVAHPVLPAAASVRRQRHEDAVRNVPWHQHQRAGALTPTGGHPRAACSLPATRPRADACVLSRLTTTPRLFAQYGVAAECERSIIKGGKISTAR